MKTYLPVFKLLAIVTACLFSGWMVYQKSELLAQKTEPAPPKPQLTVEVVRTKTTEVEDRIELIGSIQAEATVQVRSRVDGYIQNMLHRLGEAVKQNESLIQLDASRNLELVQQAESSLKVAQAQLQAREHAMNMARREWLRIQKYLDSEIFTEQQQQEMRTQLEISEAEVQLASAQVEAARSVWQSRKLELEELEIKSPMSGIIAERFAEPGDLAKSDSPLLSLINIDQVRVMVNVAEKDYQSLHPGQQASLKIDALPQMEFAGIVRRKAPVLDPATRTAVVEIQVANPEHLMKPGMHARATVICSKRRQAITVPAASLVDRDGRSVVYVFDQTLGIVKEQNVQPGVTLADLVEIIAGVRENTPIVRLGSRMIQDGQEVAVNWIDVAGK